MNVKSVVKGVLFGMLGAFLYAKVKDRLPGGAK